MGDWTLVANREQTHWLRDNRSLARAIHKLHIQQQQGTDDARPSRQRSPQDLARQPLGTPNKDVLYVSNTTPRLSGIDVQVAYLRPHHA